MMKRSVLLVILAACLSGTAAAAAAGKPIPKKPARTVSGMIYFTNNTPKDRSYFIELSPAPDSGRSAAVPATAR